MAGVGLPSDSATRKGLPVTTGCLDYFPLALLEVSRLSLLGNEKHNPGQPLHWSHDKSSDHADCLARHLLERGTPDPDMGGLSHTVHVAWRALALLETELREKAEKEKKERDIARLYTAMARDNTWLKEQMAVNLMNRAFCTASITKKKGE